MSSLTLESLESLYSINVMGDNLVDCDVPWPTTKWHGEEFVPIDSEGNGFFVITTTEPGQATRTNVYWAKAVISDDGQVDVEIVDFEERETRIHPSEIDPFDEHCLVVHKVRAGWWSLVRD